MWKWIMATLFLTSIVYACKKDTFQERDGVCPQVILTSPLNGALEVPLNSIVEVTFNEKMNPTTIDAACFELSGPSVVAGTLTYNDGLAKFTFVPAQPLTSNTTYTGRVKTSVRDMFGNALQKEYVWSFSTGLNITPIVMSTDPLNNETNVPLSKVISATFSHPMNPSSINDSSFTLKTGSSLVSGVVTYSDSTAYFTPLTPLNPDAIYTATITASAKSLNKGNMASSYSWAFRTSALVKPYILSVEPANLAIGVPLNQIIKVKFSAAMKASSIVDSTFTLSMGTTPIAGNIGYLDSTATFSPQANLLPNTLYTATVKYNVQNTAGTTMLSDYSWTFTTLSVVAPTVILTNPLNLAANVPVNQIVTADFSAPMDPLTINGTTFMLKQGVNVITGLVAYSGTRASFTPSVPLSTGKVYTATITNSAKNMAGTNMVSNYVWSFTTVAGSIPSVISTDPANLAVNVPLNQVVRATFSEPMDVSTINGTSFTLQNGATSITGLVSYSGGIASFTPGINLLPGTTYTATITSAAKNIAGVAMASNHVWTFTTFSAPAPTVVSTDPANLATNVLLNKVISATFSELMDPLTITNATFTLKLGVTPVAGTVSYVGGNALFTPTANLLSGNTYTATITTGAKNPGGTGLASNYVWTFNTKAPSGPLPPDLKSVARFGIIAGVGVSNNAGFSVINNMDVGISPGARSGVTGFPPATVVGGAIYASDDIAPPGTPAMLIQAKQDLTDAYLFAEAAVSPAPVTVSGDQGGLTLAPGVYKSTSTLLISNGNLTLDAQGDVNAVWIFQVASGFTTVGGAGGSVILTGGAQAKNVYWQVGTSAVIGDNTSFKGNLLVLTSITLNSNAVLQGRVLCRNGAVVLTSTNIINKP